MSPPINIDGSQVSGITIDGTSVSEVTVDGDVVFSAIPDSEDLHARYDATELSLSDQDSVTTWPDETANGHDLSASGDPMFVESGINGNPVVRFNGIDDLLSTSFATISQPNHIFIALEYQSVTDAAPVFDSERSTAEHVLEYRDSDNVIRMFAGVVLDGGTPDTNPHIHATLFDGPDSVNRQDGSQISNGDSGDRGLDGFKVGSGAGNFAEVDVAEILIYPEDKTSIQSDVETYLSNKWGISVST